MSGGGGGMGERRCDSISSVSALSYAFSLIFLILLSFTSSTDHRQIQGS